MALAPLAFAGAPRADGRIMGLVLILPRGPEPQEAGRCLEPMEILPLRPAPPKVSREPGNRDEWREYLIRVKKR